MKDLLISQFSQYPGSAFFIESAFIALSHLKEKQLKYFISNFFQNNKIDEVSNITVRKLAAHYNNVAFDKLKMKDYLNYSYTSHHVSMLRMVAREMEGE